MPLWLQHTLVLLLVAGCLAFVAREGIKAIRGKRNCGSCKTCGVETRPAAHAPPTPAQPRVAFIPFDALSARAAKRYKD